MPRTAVTPIYSVEVAPIVHFATRFISPDISPRLARPPNEPTSPIAPPATESGTTMARIIPVTVPHKHRRCRLEHPHGRHAAHGGQQHHEHRQRNLHELHERIRARKRQRHR